MKKKKYDFTVIGAGPMGLYLSYLLSKNNYKVRLIDANKKANQLATEVSDLLSSMKDQSGKKDELAERIANLRTKITEINKSTTD